MVLVDARGLPVSIDTVSAQRHGSRLIQRPLDLTITEESPRRVVGDNAYDSDQLDEELAEQGIEMIAPYRSSRKIENYTQDGRCAATTGAGTLSGPFPGCRTSAGCAFAERSRRTCSAAFFTWAAPCCCSGRFGGRIEILVCSGSRRLVAISRNAPTPDVAHREDVPGATGVGRPRRRCRIP